MAALAPVGDAAIGKGPGGATALRAAIPGGGMGTGLPLWEAGTATLPGLSRLGEARAAAIAPVLLLLLAVLELLRWVTPLANRQAALGPEALLLAFAAVALLLAFGTPTAATVAALLLAFRTTLLLGIGIVSGAYPNGGKRAAHDTFQGIAPAGRAGDARDQFIELFGIHRLSPFQKDLTAYSGPLHE